MAAEIEKTPTQDTSVNKPASGTYGERADLERLRRSLPIENTRPIPQPSPVPVPEPSVALPADTGGRPKMAPPSVPGVVLSPTGQPGVPVQTPLRRPAPPLGGARTRAEARVFLLQALATSEEVSAETREWAQTVLDMLRA